MKYIHYALLIRPFVALIADYKRNIVAIALILMAHIFVLLPTNTFAQVSGPADAGRIERRVKELGAPMHSNITPAPVTIEKGTEYVAPAGSEKIKFILRDITFTGAEHIKATALYDTYAEYLGKQISLDTLWKIAARVSKQYQQAGYFLTHVYVPRQEIGEGKARLTIAEGFISEIGLDDAARANPRVVEWTNQLLMLKPLASADLERLLLRLNDLPGESFQAVLELPTDKNAPEGSSRLSVVSSELKPTAHSGFDNNGSLYLGPYQISQNVTIAPFMNQKTSLAVLASAPADELKYASITHEIVLGYHWDIDANAGLTAARPGDSLSIQNISSVSRTYGFGATYHWLQQRNENFTTRMGFESRDVHASALGGLSTITNDHIRALRANANYTLYDSLNGYNNVTTILSHGINAVGSSESGALNLSRAEAKPNFTKFEFNATHFQPLPYAFILVGATSGQLASGPLYSSEEFGYGGPNFGRAYDNSEITGDHGLAASLELRYTGIPSYFDAQVTPYSYYDIGKVWNEDTGQSKPLSASSAGFGLRLAHDSGVNANFGAAFPLTRGISAPLDGRKQGPRLTMQLGVDF